MILSLDIGATAIKTGIFDDKNQTFCKEKIFLTEHNKSRFKYLINNILEEYSQNYEFKKIGIGFPGNLRKNGEIIFSPNLPFLCNENIFNIFNTGQFSIKFENDANCAAIGALIVYKKNDIITLTIGTGIGGGVILKKQLLSNFSNIGFEFGHITVKENGEPCNCGKKGCLESYSSATGMLSIFKKNTGKDLYNFKELYDLFLNKDKVALNIIKQGFQYLGLGASIITNIFAPELIVLTGGVATCFHNFKNFFYDFFNKYTLDFLRHKTEISVYTKNNLGLVGAAGLFL